MNNAQYKVCTTVYYDGKYTDTINEMWTYEKIQNELERLSEMHEKQFLSYTYKIVNGAYYISIYF